MTIIVIVLLFLFVMIILSLLYVLSYAKLSSNHTTCSFTIWRYSLPAILKMSGAVAATTRRAAPATSTLPAEKVQNLIQVGCKHRKHTWKNLGKTEENHGELQTVENSVHDLVKEMTLSNEASKRLQNVVVVV